MIHALVLDGQITAVGLPPSGRLADGRTVSGYDRLDPATLTELGWVQVVDDVPAYDPLAEQVSLDRYEITGDHVTARYVVDIAGSNTKTLTAKLAAALAANAADLTQDASIVTKANLLIATTGTRTTAQLSDDMRTLAQAVKTLALNDTNAKKELGALIRFALGLFTDTTGT